MTVHPVVKPIGNAARQPKVASGVANNKPFGKPKAPCQFCKKVRERVKTFVFGRSK